MRKRDPAEITTIGQFGGPLDDEHSEPLEPDDRDGVLAGIEDILTHYRSDAFVLEAYGHVAEARLIHELCSDVSHAVADFLAFVDEEKAMRLMLLVHRGPARYCRAAESLTVSATLRGAIGWY